jgi:adenylyltransferase/sulfurtransferase
MASRVVLVGCGALGTMQAALLARAGVGELRIIDRDFVEESNLQRQILFDEEDARRLFPKAIAAENKLRAVNSLIRIEGLVEDLNASNAARLLEGFDLIVDASDNFDARFLVNDYSIKTNTPWIYGACVGSYGLVFPVIPGETSCLHCVYESAPAVRVSASCDTAGVVGPIVGVIASLQVSEALKILTGSRERVNRRISTFDLWKNSRDAIDLPPPDPDCWCCGKRRFEYLEGGRGAEAATLCGRNAVQIRRRDSTPIDIDALADRLSPLWPTTKNRFLVRVDIDGCQITVFADGRAIISGTNDPAIAKSLYARYVGA